MVNIVHNGRRSIAHHKLEALYGKFAKAGAACAVTLENALALSVFDEIEDHRQGDGAVLQLLNELV